MRPILVTGATGAVGSRVLAALEREGRPARALTRSAGRLDGNASATTEVVEGDVRDRDSIRAALEGADAAVYLVHSLSSSGSFADEDREAAEAFAAAAAAEGLRRIVYLGGIGRGPDLSDHLRSRQEVGEILRSAVPTVELRASIVVGAASVSFRLVHALVESMPVVGLPAWVRTPCQPIAIDDVAAYVVEALDVDVSGSAVFEIGGADRVTYLELVEEVVRQSGRTRAVLVSPLPAPPASTDQAPVSWLAGLLPERARVAAALVDSLRFDTSVEDPAALATFSTRPRGLADAVAAALQETENA